MIVCSSSHDEIVYEGGWCPVCELVDQLDEKTAECELLQEKIDELEDN